MNENIIKELNNDWIEISKHKYLSEDFIRKYNNKLYWGWITMIQNLSDDFIIEFQDKISWNEISEERLNNLIIKYK